MQEFRRFLKSQEFVPLLHEHHYSKCLGMPLDHRVYGIARNGFRIDLDPLQKMDARRTEYEIGRGMWTREFGGNDQSVYQRILGGMRR